MSIENINQGKYYYKHNDHEYRENMMVVNFIRAFDKLKDKDIMGRYGGGHIGLHSLDCYNLVPCIENQLNDRYGNIYSENLVGIEKEIDPTRVDTIEIKGKEYTAKYFGKQDVMGYEDYKKIEFWQLENAYNDFMNWMHFL